MVSSGVLGICNIPQFVSILSSSRTMFVRWRFGYGRPWLGMSLVRVDVNAGTGTMDRLFWSGIVSHWATNCVTSALTMNSTKRKGSWMHMCPSISTSTSTSVFFASPLQPSCVANHQQVHWLIWCNMTGPNVTASRELRYTLSTISMWSLCMFADRNFLYLCL